MADDVEFKINLDNKEALDNISKMQKSLGMLGSADSMAGLLESLKSVGAILGPMAVVAFGVKESFDLVFDAEKIKAVNNQFEIFSQNAGISSEKLKSGLVEAAKGLADETDLLKVANKALVEMGENANKLPQVLELARKVTSAFGGDLISNFENINQAIASGNLRQLKNMGIILDQKKVYKDYAESIGLSVRALSQQDRQQAVLNAVLAKGADAFKGVNTDIRQATNLWTEFKVTVKELGEVFSLAFNKLMGPAVISLLKSIKDTAHFFKNEFVASFGEGAEKSRARIESIDKEMARLKAHATEIIQRDDLVGEEKDRQFKADMDRIHKLYVEKKSLTAETTKNEESEIAKQDEISKNHVKNQHGDADEIAKERLNAEERISNAKKQRLDSDQKMVKYSNDIEADLDEQHQERLQLMEEHYSIEREKILRERHDGLISAADEQVLLAQNTQEKLNAMDQERLEYEDKKRDAIIEHNNYIADHSKNTSESVSAGWKAASMQTVSDMQKSSNLGRVAFSSLQNNAKSAFIAMGDGSKTAGQAMKGFMFGALADIAEASGELHVAKGLASMNPMEFTEGGVLLALSGFLRSQAGGGASGGMGGGGGGGGGGGAGSMGAGGSMPASAPQAQQSMQLVVQGNIFDSDATRTRLMEMMRQAQDMQDFKLVQVGQT